MLAHPSALHSKYREVMVGGLKTARVSRRELTSLMVEHCLTNRLGALLGPKLVFAVNGHTVSLAATDAQFRKLHDFADIIHADGQPIVMATKVLTETPIPERTATTDFIHDAATVGRAYGLKFYLLGATEDANARCAEKLQQLYPGLEIVGRRNGYFSQEDEAGICEEINRSGADVVWVGMGIPLEQAFCVRNKHRIDAGWMVTAGGCFNFVIGDYRRAPGWMQTFGLEWLYRIWREPRRLFWRYAVTNPHALYLLLTRTHSLPPYSVPHDVPENNGEIIAQKYLA